MEIVIQLMYFLLLVINYYKGFNINPLASKSIKKKKKSFPPDGLVVAIAARPNIYIVFILCWALFLLLLLLLQ